MTEAAAAARVRVGAGLATALAVLVAWNLVGRPALPERWHLLGSILVGAVVLGVARVAHLDWEQLGLGRQELGPGLRWGAAAFGVIAGVVVLASLLPATRHLFSSTRADIGVGRLLLEALVTIPIGTAVVEELAFRGVLLGMMRSRLAVVPAVAVTSVLFGLWHLEPILGGGGSLGHRASVALGTFVATTTAGVGFAWLRIRSGSLLAPIMAHVATNSVSLVAAWLVVH
jgi:membrane protease YdiL (CAAX protease family)